MDCPYGCGWKGTPEEYSKKHYDVCPKRPRTPGRHADSERTEGVRGSFRSLEPGETFTLFYKGDVEGPSIRLIKRLKDEPEREYWLYEVVSDHSQHEGWFPKLSEKKHPFSSEDFTKEQLEFLLTEMAQFAVEMAKREIDWVKRGVQRDIPAAKCNMYQYLERLLTLSEIAEDLRLKGAKEKITSAQDQVKSLVKERGWLPSA